MLDLIVELQQLRLHGMAAGWAELLEQGNVEVASSQWLLERLLQAESTDRAVRSVSHQMNAAKFPVHRDLAGFEFDGSPVDRQLVMQLAGMTFTESAHNLVLVGGPGSGKTHLATAIGVSGIMHHGKRVRFYCKRELTHTAVSRRVGLDHAGANTSRGLAMLNGNRSLISASAARCGSSVSTRSR
jgi:DNA replication protein DnaC